LRRELILSAAKRCFARNGFAGTTTKSVAAAASISEGLLFKHFPTKSALYAEILAEECEADPALNKLLGLAPSTETLVVLVRGMVGHFLQVSRAPDQEEAQRLRLMTTFREDEFAWTCRSRSVALRNDRQGTPGNWVKPSSARYDARTRTVQRFAPTGEGVPRFYRSPSDALKAVRSGRDLS